MSSLAKRARHGSSLDASKLEEATLTNPARTISTEEVGANGGERRSNRFVEAFARGLSVVRAFGPDAPEMSLARIAERTGLTRANVRRILLTLVELGYIQQDGKMFRLRPQILDLGYSYLSSASLPRVAQPIMEDVTARLQMPCNLSVLQGDDVIVIGRVAARRTIDVGLDLNIGRRFPAYITPMGRLLLAGLPEGELGAYLAKACLRRLTARTVVDPAELRRIIIADLAKGWSLVDQEHSELISSLAVPVTDASSRVAATLSIGWTHGDLGRDEAVVSFLPVLKEAAAEVSRFMQMGSHQRLSA